MSLIKVNNRGQQDTLGRRNLIINGAMQVAQRGSTTINGAESYGQVDRFKGYGISGGQFSLAQSTDAPAGFVRSLIATVTSADSSIASGDYYGISHRIEGHNVARLNYGTSNAQTTTLSFYVKSSLTGTFGGAIRNSAANRSFNFSYTINSANTWERKSYTIIGDQTGTWLQDGGIGLRVTFSLGDGSARLASAGSWNAGNYAGVTGQTNLISTGSATLQLTGLQLEQGTIMTDFEHRSFGEEFELCKRYYQKSFIYSQAPVNAGNTTSNSYNGNITGYCGSNNSGIYSGGQPLSPEMRANPTMTTYGNSNGHWGQMIPTNTGTVSYSAGAGYIGHIRTNGFSVGQNISGNVLMIGFGQWTADAEL